MYSTIKIVKVRPEMFVVDVSLASGYTKATPFDDEDLAVAYAQGLSAGFLLAKITLDHGLRFDGVIYDDGDAR